MAWIVDKGKLIFEDMKSSLYFKAWLFFWLVLVGTAFVFFIQMGRHATVIGREGKYRTYIKDYREEGIPIPNFQFTSQSDATFTTMTCVRASINETFSTLTMQPCDDHNQCLMFVNQDSVAGLVGDRFTEMYPRVKCNFDMDVPADDTNLLVGFETLGDFQIDGASNEPLMVLPQPWTAWILLSYALFEGYPLFYRDLTYNGFNPNMIVNASTMTTLSYEVELVNNAFFITDSVPDANWARINSMGYIGGSCFFLLILHSAIMIIVGFFLDNDSQFLAKKGMKTSGSSGNSALLSANL